MAKKPIESTPSVNTGVSVRMYGAGGAGINIVSRFGILPPSIGVAGVEPVYVDTSSSNLKTVADRGNVFLLKDVDGSGKVRRENSGEIASSIPELLLAHGPLALNIVVFSASGGSGSVYGPLIIKELLERGESVLAVVIGSCESALTTENTLNTLKSLSGISEKTASPVVVFYSQNPEDAPRTEVDNVIFATLRTVLVLGSQQNEGLDTRDLSNFLRYDRATRVQPQLSLMEVFQSGDVEAITESGIKHPIAVASVFANKEKAVPLRVPFEYLAEGYRPTVESFEVPDELHFLIHADEVKTIVTDLSSRVDRFREFSKSRQAPAKVLNGNEADDNGMVF